MHKPTLNILVALHSEAVPLINHFRLSKRNSTGIQVYAGVYESSTINLVVTGIGRLNMAAAVAWLAAQQAEQRCAWLNVGTAGHKSHPLATPVRVAYCEGEPNGRGHYLPLVANWDGEVGHLLTADRVSSDYPEQALVDMECSAFLLTAVRFAPAELVQAIKVVSDNQESGVEQLDAARLTALVEECLPSIVDFSRELCSLASSLPIKTLLDDEIEALLARIHVTTSQKLQLLDLSQKLINCGAERNDLGGQLKTAPSAKQLISDWNNVLQSCAPVLPTELAKS